MDKGKVRYRKTFGVRGKPRVRRGRVRGIMATKRLTINSSHTAVNEILQKLWNMGTKDPQRVLTLASLRLWHLEHPEGGGWAQRCLRWQREYRELIEADERRTYQHDPRPPHRPKAA